MAKQPTIRDAVASRARCEGRRGHPLAAAGDSVQASVLRIRVTPISAAAAGAVTGIAASVFERLNLVGPFWFTVLCFGFFLVPVLVGVAGLDHLRTHWTDWSYQSSRKYLVNDVPQALLRGLCWFLAASVAAVVCSYVLNWR
jgi:hypothetical protein